jgi:ferredoxin-NADP reductase
MYQQQCVLRLLAPPNLRLREAFACGAPQRVDKAGDVLARSGVSRKQLHMEQR